MPWVKEKKKHKCKFPILWRFKELGREWECPTCLNLWRIHVTPLGEKQMVLISVVDCWGRRKDPRG